MLVFHRRRVFLAAVGQLADVELETPASSRDLGNPSQNFYRLRWDYGSLETSEDMSFYSICSSTNGGILRSIRMWTYRTLAQVTAHTK